jgi:hypothetical protein
MRIESDHFDVMGILMDVSTGIPPSHARTLPEEIYVID